jgi:hypothetical protein
VELEAVGLSLNGGFSDVLPGSPPSPLRGIEARPIDVRVQIGRLPGKAVAESRERVRGGQNQPWSADHDRG